MKIIIVKIILIFTVIFYWPNNVIGVSRLYDRNTGDVINADNDDAEWDNTNNALNTHVDATTAHGATGGVVGASSPTIASPTLTGSSTISNAIITSLSALTNGWTNNLGLSLSGGTLTVTDASGSALTSSNMGYVGLPSTTGGRTVAIQVSFPWAINDDAAASSDLTGLGFGITESANWSNDLYFYLYAVNRGNTNADGTDGNSAIFLARNPAMSLTPGTAGKIGDTAAIPSTDGVDSIIILQDVTTANYTSLPCTLIGAIRMQWLASSTDWTIQSLGSSDGIGRSPIDKAFATLMTYPANQNGANAGATVTNSHMADNGASQLADFTTRDYFWKQNRNGTCKVWIYYSGDAGANGAGANSIAMTLPVAEAGLTVDAVTQGVIQTYDVANQRQSHIDLANAAASFNILYPTSATALSNLQQADFANGNRLMQTTFEYACFLTNPS